MISIDLDDDGKKLLPSLWHYIKAIAKAYRNDKYYSRSNNKRQIIGDLGNKYDIAFKSPNIIDKFELHQRNPRKLERLITSKSNNIRIGFGSKSFEKTLTIESKGGNDAITLEGTGAERTYVHAGEGDDVIITNERLQDVIISGGNGRDTFKYQLTGLPKNLTIVEDFDPDHDSLVLELGRKAKESLSWELSSDGAMLISEENNACRLLIKGVDDIKILPSI